jgi:ArsR family transcriptional regulator
MIVDAISRRHFAMSPLMDTRTAETALKAAADPTRLRILMLLAAGDLNVKDLTRILGQSQPRVSRHLKLLVEASLIERFREGSWVYFHMLPKSSGIALGRLLVEAIDPGDPILQRDRERADALKAEREVAAQAYFRAHAAEWDRIRSLHVAEAEVEAAMRACLGDENVDFLVDLGTGTGRMLELLAPIYDRGLGLDANQAMLGYARSNLDRARLRHAQVRHGDIYDVPLADGAAGLVVMHQVLHFLSDPAQAIREAARLLRRGGRLLIADFAPHDLEFLREHHAHERLGFARAQVEELMIASGLEPADYRELAPGPDPAKPDRLTVSLWLGRKVRAAGPVRLLSEPNLGERAA